MRTRRVKIERWNWTDYGALCCGPDSHIAKVRDNDQISQWRFQIDDHHLQLIRLTFRCLMKIAGLTRREKSGHTICIFTYLDRIFLLVFFPFCCFFVFSGFDCWVRRLEADSCWDLKGWEERKMRKYISNLIMHILDNFFPLRTHSSVISISFLFASSLFEREIAEH